MTTTFETPLSPEELATGDGFEPAMDDIDCTPRPRRGESEEEFTRRMGTMTVLGMDDELVEVPIPGSVQVDERALIDAAKLQEALSEDEIDLIIIALGWWLSDGHDVPESKVDSLRSRLRAAKA